MLLVLARRREDLEVTTKRRPAHLTRPRADLG